MAAVDLLLQTGTSNGASTSTSALHDLRQLTALSSAGYEQNDDGTCSHRMQSWLLLLHVQPMRYEDYAELLERGASPAYGKIQNDVHRTLTTDPYFSRRVTQSALTRLLNTTAWSTHDRIAKETPLPPSPMLMAQDGGEEGEEGEVTEADFGESEVGQPGGSVQAGEAIQAGEVGDHGNGKENENENGKFTEIVEDEGGEGEGEGGGVVAIAEGDGGDGGGVAGNAVGDIENTETAEASKGTDSVEQSQSQDIGNTIETTTDITATTAATTTDTLTTAPTTHSSLTTHSNNNVSNSNTTHPPRHHSHNIRSSLSPRPDTEPIKADLYVQGMNVLAAPILYTSRSEPTAFALFNALLRDQIPSYFMPGLAGVHEACSLLDEVLALVDPDLKSYLPPTSNIYAFGPVMTLCASIPPLSEVLKLWDFLFAAGPHLGVLAVVSVLVGMREELMGMSSDKASVRLRNLGPLDAEGTIRVLRERVLPRVVGVEGGLGERILRHTHVSGVGVGVGMGAQFT